MKVLDSLFILACSFQPNQQEDGSPQLIDRFVRAYIKNGTISRALSAPPDATADIFSGDFAHLHAVSNRSASEARDYIFATMSQYPWYKSPKEAKNMSFGDIFLDLHRQALRVGHGFTGRILHSMTEIGACEDQETAWQPSKQQPKPSCLGDLLKLLGQRMSMNHRTSKHHFTTAVAVSSVSGYGMHEAFELVKTAMRFQPRTWAESHRGGELSMYGSKPEDSQDIDDLCMAVMSWTTPRLSSQWSHEERGRRAAELRGELAAEFKKRESGDWVLRQAMSMLDLMWSAVDEINVNRPLREDWRLCERQIELCEVDWSTALQEMFLLLAAMLSCQIPLSAALWAKGRFVPVKVKFRTFSVLGLLSVQAAAGLTSGPEATSNTRGVPMMSVGRHPEGKNLGRDLVLAHPLTKAPVGLLPDFLHPVRTDEEFVERVQALYDGLPMKVGPRGAIIPAVPLDAVTMEIS